jgi:hypothetical protein
MGPLGERTHQNYERGRPAHWNTQGWHRRKPIRSVAVRRVHLRTTKVLPKGTLALHPFRWSAYQSNFKGALGTKNPSALDRTRSGQKHSKQFGISILVRISSGPKTSRLIRMRPDFPADAGGLVRLLDAIVSRTAMVVSMPATKNSDQIDGRSPTPADCGLTKAVYSVNETLVLTDLGRTYLYELINSGELPLIKIGKRSLIAAPDLVRFLNSRRSQPNAA